LFTSMETMVIQRAQKHYLVEQILSYKNTDLHRYPGNKINSKLHDGVCQHCKGILEWRVKFSKYKLLSKPKKW
uniref:Uncharacterized protein n=1 Tax=Meleagris gallopavo TaxID=9103 RepID=A0A803XU38_MELGA